MEGYNISMCRVEAGLDPSVPLVLSEVEWIRMTMRRSRDDGRGELDCGEEGEYGSFLAIIFSRASAQDRNPQMALS